VSAATLAAVLLAPIAARAHFIWATIENGQVRFALLENPNEKPDVRFESYVARMTTALALDAPRDGARTANLASAQKSARAETTVGVKERNGVSYLLRYRARAAADLASAGLPTKGAATDVTVTQDGATMVITALQDGWPCPETEVTLHWPGGEASATTNLAGTARLPWPKLEQSGFVGVRAKIIEGVPGESEGKKFAETHHWTTLSFPVSVPLSTSQTLRKALSGNHEIIGRAAFNRTLFSGAITRQQAELHLQHRALILTEVDRILRSTPALQSVYGEPQRACVAYLSSDLKAHGIALPTPESVSPPIRDLLEELRTQDAYFALGVWHVFYGGTVNGGRMIGVRLEKVLGVALTHYSKTDGYREYLLGIDRLDSPVVREALARGAQAAYRHLTASMNDEIFSVGD
jgi:hypothetical protein